MTAFRSVVLDVDSTVSAVEGIDWLATLRDESTALAVATLTNDAMEARVALDEVYQRRLAIIAPTRDEIAALSNVYIATALPGARDAIAQWRGAGVRVLLVSGGLRDAIRPLAAWLGISESDLHAVDVTYDARGTVSGLAAPAPLARRGGKPRVVQSLELARPLLAVGDGATDAELTACVDSFLAFTGVARRASVVAAAAGEVADFASLTPIVLGH